MLEYVDWELDKENIDNDPRELTFYQTHAMGFGALTLKYRYIYGAFDFRTGFLGPRLDRLRFMELQKHLHEIPPGSLSQGIMYKIQSGSGYDMRYLDEELARCGIILPGYDDKIPPWYTEWAKQKFSKAQETAVQIDS